MPADKAKHTPGPWITDDRHVHPDAGRLTYPPGVEPETDVIVLVDTDCHENGLLNETDKANLRLIAAAPEMLEALRNALPACEYYDEREGAPETLRTVQAAIAKAQGKP